jgi:hypothetical protein
MKRIISVAATLTAIALAAAACGGANGAPKATTPTTAAISAAAKAREAATFLKLVAPYNSERTRVVASEANARSTAELQAFLAPLVTASNTFAGAIQRSGFTGPAATPAQTLAIGVESVVADIESATRADWTSDKAVIARAEGQVDHEDDALRAILGLPAANP